MAVDRYVKIVLTIIALELFWIGIKDTAPPVAAQAQAPAPAAATPVIIRGIQIAPNSNDYLPVGIVGQPVRVEVAGQPVRVDVGQPVKVEADRALPVQAIPYTPTNRPGQPGR
jgi:hypothetical protein